jgi:hypothetical protein
MPELKEVEVDGAGDTDTPIHKKALSYSFIPGPFTIALSKAYADPNNPYYLIIDEINRGNAPAIFGEAFQLLDRNRRTKASEYGVDNHEVAEKIYADLNLEQKNRLGDKVFIPGNLTIIATMNTGDQNVFRLDTAFSRRWSKELVRNQFESAEEDTEEEKEYLCNLSNTILLKEEPNVSTLNPHNITWKKFAQSINKKINDLNQNGDFSEDKGLGTFFVVPEECKKAKAFGEKVLMYLWYDVFRYGNKTDIFEQPRASFEFMMDAFEKEGLNIFKENIFANIQEHAGTTATLPGATDTHNQDGE